MSGVVVDSSAVLAVLLAEPESAEVADELTGALISAVNLAEVVGKLLDYGTTEEDTRRAIRDLHLVEVPFEPPDGWAAGFLRSSTRAVGLSLGDRACLALALSRGVPALTKDRAWGRLGLGKAVRVIGR